MQAELEERLRRAGVLVEILMATAAFTRGDFGVGTTCQLGNIREPYKKAPSGSSFKFLIRLQWRSLLAGRGVRLWWCSNQTLS